MTNVKIYAKPLIQLRSIAAFNLDIYELQHGIFYVPANPEDTLFQVDRQYLVWGDYKAIVVGDAVWPAQEITTVSPLYNTWALYKAANSGNAYWNAQNIIDV